MANGNQQNQQSDLLSSVLGLPGFPPPAPGPGGVDMSRPVDIWRAQNQGMPPPQLTAPSMPSAEALGRGPQDVFNPASSFGLFPLESDPRGRIEALRTMGPEDQGKLRIQALGEQALGSALNLPFVAGEALGEAIPRAISTPVLGGPDLSGTIRGLFGRVGETNVKGQQQGQQQNQLRPKSPEEIQQAFGAQGQGQSFLVPLPGGSPSQRLPQVPDLQSPDFGGILEAQRQNRPVRPDIEGTAQNFAQRPIPEEPPTGALEERVQILEENKPERQMTQEEQDTRRLVSVLGALAAGAAAGDGTTAGTFAAMGARGAQALIQDMEKEAEEDRTFQQRMQKHQQAVLSAKQDLQQTQFEFEQLRNDIHFGNEQRRTEAQRRAQELQRQYHRDIRKHRSTVLRTQLEAQKAKAKAVNKRLELEYDRAMEQVEVQNKATKVDVKDGQIIAQVRTPEGIRVQTTPVSSGGSDQVTEALGLAEDLIGVGQTQAGNFLADMTTLTAAGHNGSPEMGFKAVAQSLAREAPRFLGEKFPDVAAQIREELAQQGLVQGQAGFAQAFQGKMTERIAEELSRRPDLLREAAKENIIAWEFLDKFMTTRGQNGGR